MYQLALPPEGYAVEVCADGLSSLAQIAARPPAFVVVDSDLPPMGGMAIVEHLRKKGRLVPIVLVSSRHDEGIRRECGEWFRVEYLAKPFSLQELFQALIRVSQF